MKANGSGFIINGAEHSDYAISVISGYSLRNKN
jgi:hypothetical protein